MVAGMASAPIASTTSRPLLAGIWTSRKTRSGFVRRMISIASSPVEAVPATSIPRSRANRSSMRWRARGSSSAMTTRRSAMHRYSNGCYSAAIRSGGQSERGGGSVELLQPRAGVAQADAPLPLPHARPIVSDRQHQPAAVAARLDFDLPVARRPAGAVLERILDDRLQDQARNRNVERPGIDFRRRPQAPLKADLHDLDVPLEKFELLAQRNCRAATAVDGVAQQ